MYYIWFPSLESSERRERAEGPWSLFGVLAYRSTSAVLVVTESISRSL